MWFDSWSDVARVLLVGPSAYVALVVVLRVSGKRTLAKLNAFDFIVTVALGSTLATILLSSEVSWAEGAAALLALALLQLVVALGVSRWPPVQRLVTSSPTCLVVDGELVDAALRGQRIARAEVWQAVRGAGYGDLAQVAAVVLESDGSLSVVGTAQRGDGSALRDVDGASRG
ncbi:MAG: YetF domain-containing protein [Nocardioidaceae bacterium]